MFRDLITTLHKDLEFFIYKYENVCYNYNQLNNSRDLGEERVG